ncbi:MAG: GWxTD domain-containing protein [Gemmatimonadaceae bacterium]
MPTINRRDAKYAIWLMCISQLTLAFLLPAQKPLSDSSRAKQSQQTILAGATARADSIADAGDSLAAYAMLDSMVKHSKRDGPAWHAYGVLAWNMAHSSRVDLVNKSQQAIRWLIAADSALHLAAAYAPDSAIYWRDIARFKLDARSGWQQFAAGDFMAKAVDAAERAGNSELTAEMADEMGMIQFREYETQAAISDGNEMASRTLLGDPEFLGFAPYTFALDYFLRATKANAKYPLARRHLYMTYAERGNWKELLSASGVQLAHDSRDKDALLARGLAYERLDRSAEASVVFDSVLALMTPEARASFTRISRLLPTSVSQRSQYLPDSITFSRMIPAQQELVEKMVWALLDPLIETKENEYRTEFFARIVFADFRFTREAQGIYGPDSDRGSVFIRHGPPDFQSAFFALQMGTHTWRYRNGLTVTFKEPSRTKIAAGQNTNQLKNSSPVSWDNVPITRLTDQSQLRIAAFRKSADSVDVVVAADIPASKMVGKSDMAGPIPLNGSTRVIDGQVKEHQIFTWKESLDVTNVPDHLMKGWTHQVGAGLNIIRFDEFQPDTRRVARGIVAVDPARPTGFGLSDILFGSITSTADKSANRWRDVKIKPSVGLYKVGESIGMVWENYELARAGNEVRYNVSITIAPVPDAWDKAAGKTFDEPTPPKGIVARIRSAFGNTELGQSNGKGFTVTFSRTAEARSVIVESMTLDLPKGKPGVYDLKIEVTDSVSGLKSSRLTQFQVVK